MVCSPSRSVADRRPLIRFGKRVLYILPCLLIAQSAVARQGQLPPSQRYLAPLLPTAELPTHTLEAVNSEKLLAKHSERPSEALIAEAQLFAEARQVSLSPEQHGHWQELTQGDRLWRLRVHVPGATDLNFAFSPFHLPPGAQLYVVAEEGDPANDGRSAPFYGGHYYEGPYTAQDNASHGELWTPLIPGPRAVIELYLPANPTFAPQLLLSQVNAGFRDVFRREVSAKQGPCHVDVVCAEADPWRDQVRSVAWYTAGGIRRCSGSLVTDVPRSGRPFFLTAAHCGINAGNAASAVFYWNYQSPTCGLLGGGSLSQNQTGAIFRSRREDVDMSLVELEEQPDPAFAVFYNGWERRAPSQPGAVNIHHPGFDEKAININLDPVGVRNSCITHTNTGPTHWLVDDWEQGTTEGGSSGSPLYETATKRLIGFLSGGTSSCVRIFGYDCYGRFDVAWDGPTPTSRLRDWLDPAGTDVLGASGLDPNQPGGGSGPGSCPLPPGHSRYCLDCGPCSAGQGDCDGNDQCAAGLQCRSNVGAQFGFASAVDVCLSPDGSNPGGGNPGGGNPGGGNPDCALPAGHSRYCVECGPCTAGQGDCDGDDQCAAGFQCASNVGAQFGFAAAVDVCLPNAGATPNCSLPAGHGRFCDECGPCASGQGDCDRDSDCLPGLRCVANVGSDFGFNPIVDVCQ